ncbi:recombinase family protein [Candidatus Odyssella thessalonicensis]|uniref:recombinase family protein n=1 Tax=Candidatus Odyssella thessalonicensis TaxID=84647 RepID=UPI000225ACC6|nr:recombinase family protein [Candidatus Odyssella thessalonicensis]
MIRIYGYLRASTKEQNAKRAKQALESFVADANSVISGWFIENESGATLKRPELFRLLDIAQRGDILLVEQVDRISRLNSQDWELLKSQITGKGIIVVAFDLPTSHQFINSRSDEFTQRMLTAINSMMLDVLAAVARKDYEDRRRRQSEGIAKAKMDGKYKGRPANLKRNENITALLNAGKSYTDIVNILGCSRSTISKVRKSTPKP